MDSINFDHLMSLTNPEEVIKESRLLLAAPTNVDEKASLLISLHTSYCQLHRLQEARQVLEEIDHLEIADLEIRLNAEFCEPTLLAQEGKYDESLAAFAAMLDRHYETFKALSIDTCMRTSNAAER
jgi:hypothetical protein